MAVCRDRCTSDIHSNIDQGTGELGPLATPFDETVIGVERATMALHNRSSVFELECLAPLIQHVQDFQKQAPVVSGEGMRSDWAIADYVRALLFLMADGAPAPGKGGREGIVRRLIRETLTRQKNLGITERGFIPDLTALAVALYRGRCPDLQEARVDLLRHFGEESARFERTLSAGCRQLDRLLERGGNGTISGEQALDLVKRRGVPLILLQIELARRKAKLSLQAYQQAYRRWRRAESEAR